MVSIILSGTRKLLKDHIQAKRLTINRYLIVYGSVIWPLMPIMLGRSKW